VICVAVAVLFLVEGKDVVLMAGVVVVGVPCIVVILSGRNPRWLQSPADRRAAKKRRESN
jgi:hypothetical protein